MLKIEKVSESVTYIATLDPDLEVFDIEMITKYGSTYNSYLIHDGGEGILIDGTKEKFFDEYLQKLKELIPLENIKYVVVNHTEPDHSGELGQLLSFLPNAKIVGTSCALGFLKDITNKDFEKIEVKGNTELTVGTKTVRFIPSPNLHWPDSMFTYLVDENIIFTCDVFGAHYCTDKVYQDKVESFKDYRISLKYYFDCIFGPFKQDMRSGLQKISGLKLKLICPSHGPILRDKSIPQTLDLYNNWALEHKVEEDKVVIIYTSAYGYTKQMAEEISKAISEYDLKTVLLDLVYETPERAISEIHTSSGFLVGTPTINGDTLPHIWDVLTKLSPKKVHDKLTAVFGSYGWSGEAVRNVESRLSQLKCEVIRPGLRIKFNPNTPQKLEKCYLFGKAYAEKFLLMRKQAHSDWAMVKTGKWKCLVCGEIYYGEYPPEECPACGAPSDQFIQINDDEAITKNDVDCSIIIIGGGIAAISAIEEIRKRNSKSKITLLSEENIFPYYRILLSKKLCTDASCALKNEIWFKEMNVELKLNTKVESIEPKTKTVLSSSNEAFYYDKLIIATGSRANKLQIYGENKEGVFYLRTKNDFDKINQYSQNPSVKDVVVIGGGILGIEIACSLIEKGMNVTVVEFGPRLMPRQLDSDGSTILLTSLKKQKINFILSESVSEIYGTGEEFKYVCGVKLQHLNQKLDCQMVIISTGIQPNKEIVQNTNIKTHKGIIVDSQMKTSLDDIYACGDVAELNNNIYGLWSFAIEQGKIAGINAINGTRTYNPQPIATSFTFKDFKLFSIGNIPFENSQNEFQILELSDPQMESYRKFYFKNNQFVGGILIGNTSKASQLRKALDKNSTMQTFLDAHFLDE